MIIRRITGVYRASGFLGVLRAIVRRIRTPHARSLPVCQGIVRGGIGVEVGGPSPIFARGGLIPLYPLAARVDNCNFAQTTIWEGAIEQGDSFRFDSAKAPGTQFSAEGAELGTVANESYDFVLSSHMLEHTANPLGALSEWKRVLKSGGGLVLVVPHRDGTFDHRRPVTALTHLRDDFEKSMREDDVTHLPEILELHDISMDPGADDAESFRERAMRNTEARSLHHHVFDTALAFGAVEAAGFAVEAVEPMLPYHIIVVARKRGSAAQRESLSRDSLLGILHGSPFRTDRSAT